MKKVVFVVGPTASGKTSLALRLAKAFSGEIVSCDSMQIYREMEIGTAKPTPRETAEVPHHLINIRSVAEDFSVYDYKALALSEIHHIQNRGALPIVAGGTGLYADALIRNTDFGEFKIDPEVRKHWEKEFEAGNGETALEALKRVDPLAAEKLTPKDEKRIIRALEVFSSTGKPLSEFQAKSQALPPDFEYLILYLCFCDRQKLYERIDRRVDQMMENGLLQETKKLMQKGVFHCKTASQAIGYKELLPHLESGADLKTCVDLLKQHSRNYAKRQIAWFNRYPSVRLEMDTDPDPFQTAQKAVNDFIHK